MDKRKSCNFTNLEIETIVDEVESRKDTLFAKFSSAVTKRVKDEAWESVTAKVNAVNAGEVRPVKSVKKKWQDMASNAKRKEAGRRREMAATGGGTVQVLEDLHENAKILAMIAPVAIEGVPAGVDTEEVHENVRSATPVVKQEEEAVKVRQKAVDSTNLLEVEKKRPKIDESRLLVEQKRLEVEQKRLEVEEKRLNIEEQRLMLAVAAESGQNVVQVQYAW